MTETIVLPCQVTDLAELEAEIRALVPAILLAATKHRDVAGAAIRRSAMVEAADVVRLKVLELFGPKQRALLDS